MKNYHGLPMPLLFQVHGFYAQVHGFYAKEPTRIMLNAKDNALNLIIINLCSNLFDHSPFQR